MGNLFYVDRCFRFSDKNMQYTLLNCKDFWLNKSRVSMHRLPGQDFVTIPDLLVSLINQEQKEDMGLELQFGLIDVLLVAQLIQSSQPVRVLEYGCADGRLSAHLSKILGTFHNESALVCAYDTMDELWMQWMERISAIEKLPIISYLAGDYGCLQLQKDYFDIVILNGRVNFTNPQQVLEDALSLVTRSGSIFCYTDATPLLESIFKLYFEERKEYEISPSSKVLQANVSDRNWSGQLEINVDTLARKDIADIQKLLKRKQPKQKDISDMVDRLQNDIQIAAKLGYIDWKLRLLEEKEKLIELVLAQRKMVMS